MTTPARRSPPRKRKPAPQTADKRRIALPKGEPPKDASPINGVVPPVEHRFKPGNQAAVGHGRPRTMQELRELILETLAEETGDMTRARLLVRTMLVKSPSDRTTLLEYAFGKVPQVTQARTYEDDIIDLLIAGTVTEEQVTIEFPGIAPRLIATANIRRGMGGGTQSSDSSREA